ncbi:MAG: RRXRR domain-containing protein [Deltaproteobacteria bacterium]|nr:RRXRR domain-containing protein [Deltaproteobacteria bacterium]
MFRRRRKSGKTRHKATRFLNRVNNKRKEPYLATLVSMIIAHIHEINLIYCILPISKIVVVL